MKAYRHLIVGVLTYFAVFAGVLVATKSALIAVALGAVFGGGAALLTYSLLPADPELLKYQGEVRRRVRSVLKTTDQIADEAGRIKAENSRQALQKGCEVIRDLLALAQEKDRDNMAATAAKVGVYLTSVKSAVDAQIEIEAHPDYWANADQLLTANEQGFVDFRDFALGTVQRLNQGEVTALRANLRVLKPMTVPTMTP